MPAATCSPWARFSRGADRPAGLRRSGSWRSFWRSWQRRQKLVLPREVGAPPGRSEALDAVIASACARDPGDRYATMAELLQTLDKAFAKAGLPLPPPDERVSIDTVKAQNRERASAP